VVRGGIEHDLRVHLQVVSEVSQRGFKGVSDLGTARVTAGGHSQPIGGHDMLVAGGVGALARTRRAHEDNQMPPACRNRAGIIPKRLGYGFPAKAFDAEALPVRLPPEEIAVALVRHDMIEHRRWLRKPVVTERMTNQK
jgi:hypothetical protein